MAETTPRGIQATLFDYFQDTEYFDLQEANELLLEHQQRDINAESIRARIYEGIDKGLFERVGKGLYTVTRKDEQGRENTCLLINGDGRDLSMFQDNSLDAIITDHPWADVKSLKGGNRNFADYELFEYTEKDFQEKHRVLKPGHFLVEFLPEENANNYQYLFKVKEMARKAGMEYYAKVGWVKGDFVANTGRKSKNLEDVCFFTKGRARELRPDVKKNKQYAASHETITFQEHIPGGTTVTYSDMGSMGTSDETKIEPVDVDIKISVIKEDAEKAKALLDAAFCNAVIYSFENSPLDKDNGGEYSWEELDAMPVQEYIFRYLDKAGLSYDDLSQGSVEHYMSGAHGMLPSQFIFSPPSKKEKIHQAEKPVDLLKQILDYVTLPGETALDQFSGSGVLGEAALKTGRNSILIEKDEETFRKLTERLQVLGKIEAVTPAQCDILSIGSDALVAKDAYYRTGDENIVSQFIDTHDIKPKELHSAHIDMHFDEAPGVTLSKEEKLAMAAAMDAIKYLDFKAESLKKAKMNENRPEPALDSPPMKTSTPKVLECSSRGDRRFSSLFANVTIKGKEQSIEVWYQNAKRTADGKKAGKGRPFDHIICPFTGDKLPAGEAENLYKGLWITYLSKNPDLVAYAKGFDAFHDMFSGKNTMNCQADIIAAYVRDSDSFVKQVRLSAWYQNMASKKKPLHQQISFAKDRTVPPNPALANEPVHLYPNRD